MRRYSRREFPPYRHRPGRTPHPERDPEGHHYGQPEPVGRSLDEASWSENEEYLYGVDLFNAGYFWEAHAAWEAVWNETRSELASGYLRALIQLAAAFLKRELDEPAGANKLATRSLDELRRLREGSRSSRFMGVELDELVRDAASALEHEAAPPTIRLGSGV